MDREATATPSPPNWRKPGRVVWAFLLVMLAMNTGMALMLGGQWLTGFWPSVEGRIIEVGREREYSSGEWLYCPTVRYEYEVGGTRYEGDRYRRSRFCASNWQAADVAVVTAAGVGDPVRVHYDPDDPADAVLDAGPGLPELLAPLFLLPFNMFALGWLLGRSLTPGVVYEDTGPMQVARLPMVGPLRFVLGVVMMAGFVLFLVCALLLNLMTEPLVESMWLGVGALAVVAVVFKVVWNRARPRLLRVHTDGVTLASGRLVPIGRLQCVGVRAGEPRPPHPTYHTVELVAGAQGKGTTETIYVAEFPSEAEATRLADWLRRHIA